MIGTIVNASGILIGSLAGSCIKKGIDEKYQNALHNAMGIAACGLGINSIVENMPNSIYPVLFIISLALGSLIGTIINMEDKFNVVVKKYSKGNLGEGLSTAILLFCFGTLSILGPIESALNGDNTYLFTNATLDFITSIVLSTAYGIGIGIAAIVLFLWQGSIYLLAGFLSPFLTTELLTEISLIGGFLILSSGLGILRIKNMSTLNMLPSLLIPVIWFLIVK
ncbi:MAG: DUF554 domain-containing protein [Lachnospirales bacterium]